MNVLSSKGQFIYLFIHFLQVVVIQFGQGSFANTCTQVSSNPIRLCIRIMEEFKTYYNKFSLVQFKFLLLI